MKFAVIATIAVVALAEKDKAEAGPMDAMKKIVGDKCEWKAVEEIAKMQGKDA